jgi:hypothetical protein
MGGSDEIGGQTWCARTKTFRIRGGRLPAKDAHLEA